MQRVEELAIEGICLATQPKRHFSKESCVFLPNAGANGHHGAFCSILFRLSSEDLWSAAASGTKSGSVRSLLLLSPRRPLVEVGS